MDLHVSHPDPPPTSLPTPSLWVFPVSPFEGGGLRPNYREVTQPHSSEENCIKDLLSMLPHHQSKTHFAPQLVPPIRKLPQPLILIYQREDRMKPQSLTTNQTDPMDHSLV